MMFLHAMAPRPWVLRLIGAYEAAKGVLVLIAGFGLFSLGREQIHDLVDGLLRRFEWSPDSRVPRLFLELSAVTGDSLGVIAVGAVVYATVRILMGIGLWRQRPWGAWLGIVGAGLYVPIELYELSQGVSALKIGVLVVNLLIISVLTRSLVATRAARSPPT